MLLWGELYNNQSKCKQRHNKWERETGKGFTLPRVWLSWGASYTYPDKIQKDLKNEYELRQGSLKKSNVALALLESQMGIFETNWATEQWLWVFLAKKVVWSRLLGFPSDAMMRRQKVGRWQVPRHVIEKILPDCRSVDPKILLTDVKPDWVTFTYIVENGMR